VRDQGRRHPPDRRQRFRRSIILRRNVQRLAAENANNQEKLEPVAFPTVRNML